MWKRILLVLVMVAIVITLVDSCNTRVNDEVTDQEITMVIEETQVEEAETEAKAEETQVEETQTTETEVMENEVEETTSEEETSELIEFEGRQYVVPNISLGREPGVTESGYVEKFTEVPQYFQTYYPKTKYGDKTVRTSGCGIAAVSMVSTYLLDEEVPIEYLAKKYSRYKVDGGSSYGLFYQSAEDLGIEVTPVWNWKEVIAALENGQVVIATANSKSVFTKGGHFIVLSGLLEDGRILVRDPNLYNYSIWTNPVLSEGFAKGFEHKSLKYHCFPCWIYQPKDLEAIAARTEEFNFTVTETAK